MDEQINTELKSLWMAIEALSIANGVVGTITYENIKDKGLDPAVVLGTDGVNTALYHFIVEAHERLV